MKRGEARFIVRGGKSRFSVRKLTCNFPLTYKIVIEFVNKKISMSKKLQLFHGATG